MAGLMLDYRHVREIEQRRNGDDDHYHERYYLYILIGYVVCHYINV